MSFEELVICDECGAKEEPVYDCVAPFDWAKDWWYRDICPKCQNEKQKKDTEVRMRYWTRDGRRKEVV